MSRTLEDHAAELQQVGYTIVEGVLDPAQVEAARAALQEIFEREKEIGAQRNWHNNMHQVAYMLPQKHALFRSFAENPHVLPLMQLLLGRQCVLGSLNGLSMTPGGGGSTVASRPERNGAGHGAEYQRAAYA